MQDYTLYSCTAGITVGRWHQCDYKRVSYYAMMEATRL